MLNVFLFSLAEVPLGHPTEEEAGAEEVCHTVAEGMKANDLRRHHLCIPQETMTGTLELTRLLQFI